MAVKQEEEHMLCNMGDENESGVPSGDRGNMF
jgi:hypothetical protein